VNSKRQTPRTSPVGRTMAPVPAIVNEVVRSPGQPLDAATRVAMSAAFGFDFSRVRVHADERASESVRAVDALAYTVGSDIAVRSGAGMDGRDVLPGPGRRGPATSEGQRLLAHELAHVVQQRGLPAPTGTLTMGRPDTVHEREADEAASTVVAGGAAWSVSPLAGEVHVQRGFGEDGEAEERHEQEAQAKADLQRKFVATVLAEAHSGEEWDIGWIYYNRVMGPDGGESALKASNAYKLKQDWYKVWMVALGDPTYAGDKSQEQDVRDFPSIGEYVKRHGWFLHHEDGQKRADRWRDLLDRMQRDPATNPHRGWLGQGSHEDFNLGFGKWKQARQYYFLQQKSQVDEQLVKVLPKSVVFDEVAIAEFFEKNPKLLPATVPPFVSAPPPPPPAPPEFAP
jgi:hypothetical protein